MTAAHANPWNLLLESLHSAQIDQLLARYPDDKPELDLPRRFHGWTLPQNEGQAGQAQVLGVPVSFLHSQGYALLACSPGPEKEGDEALLRNFWQELIERAYAWYYDGFYPKRSLSR